MGEWALQAGSVLGALARHPDAALRERLRPVVDAWLASLEPRVSDKRARNVLRRTEGTLLLPFQLHRDEEELAVRVIRAAFSREVDAKTLRIVPPSGVGTTGGLRLTKNLRATYADGGNHHWEPGDRARGVLALGRLPVNNRGIPYRMTRFKTTVRLVDDAGLAFVLPDEVFGSPTRVSRLPAKPSIRVEGLKVDRPFRVEAGPRARGPRIKVADPTTLVKLFAVAAEGAWLTWAVDQRHGLALRIRIWLVLPQERPARTAQGLVAQEWDDEVCPWLSLGLPDIAVPAEDALAIQEWFPWAAPDVARHFWDLPLTRPGDGSRSRPKEATA